jgi:hypothetical protein
MSEQIVQETELFIVDVIVPDPVTHLIITAVDPQGSDYTLRIPFTEKGGVIQIRKKL